MAQYRRQARSSIRLGRVSSTSRPAVSKAGLLSDESGGKRSLGGPLPTRLWARVVAPTEPAMCCAAELAVRRGKWPRHPPTLARCEPSTAGWVGGFLPLRGSRAHGCRGLLLPRRLRIRCDTNSEEGHGARYAIGDRTGRCAADPAPDGGATGGSRARLARPARARMDARREVPQRRPEDPVTHLRRGAPTPGRDRRVAGR
jgi:hypothetical protein